MACENLGGCCGDVSLGRWKAFKLWVESEMGFDLGPDCVNITTGGGHSSTSKHYVGEAVDFDFDYIAVARFLVPYATGPDRMLDELFCSDVGIAYSGGKVSGFHDACCHTHAGLRPGATIPSTKRRDEKLGAYGGESIHPGERKTFGILEPGSTMPGGLVVASDGLILIPFDAFDSPDKPNPGKYRWAIVDKTGKWIAGNGAEGDLHTGGEEIPIGPGAFALTVENHEPAGGRIIGPPLFKWGYVPAGVAGFAVGGEGDVVSAFVDAPETAQEGQEQPETTGAGGDEVTAAAEPPEPPSG